MSLPLAFLGPIGPWEFALIVGVGLLLFGKNLPQVGRQIGKGVVEFKRGLNQLKQQVTEDPALREARSAFHDIKREVESPQKLLSSVRDPVRMFESLTHQDLATPGPDAQHAPHPAGSFLDAGPSEPTGP